MFSLFYASCSKEVCPAYFSSFQPKQGSANKFFAYFEPEGEEETGDDIYADGAFLTPELGEDTTLIAQQDTFKNRYGLLVFADGTEPIALDESYKSSKRKNGTVRKGSFLSDIFSSPKRRRNANYPKRVSTKNPRPFKVEEIEEDSTHQIVQKKEPPKLADQLYYEMEFGNPDAVDSAAVETQNAGDTLAPELTEEELAEETGKKGKKKKRKKKKNKKKNKGEAEATEDDFTDTEVVSEDLVKPKKQKKKKEKKKKKDKKKKEIPEITNPEDDT